MYLFLLSQVALLRYLEKMAREMGMDPGAQAAKTAKSLPEKLPEDFSQLAKNTGLPGLGAGKFPNLPGLGSAFSRKK